MKLIDADKLKEYLRKEKRWCVKSPDGEYENEGFTYDKVFFLIDMQPTIDAVQIVRCNDCVMHGKRMTEDTFRFYGYADGYCRTGKRKEGEQNDDG